VLVIVIVVGRSGRWYRLTTITTTIFHLDQHRYRNRVRNRLSVVPVRRYLPVDDFGHDCDCDFPQAECRTPLMGTVGMRKEGQAVNPPALCENRME
jgi:hypothetical protein